MHCNILMIALCSVFCSFSSLFIAPPGDCYFSLITVRKIALEHVSISVWLRLGPFPHPSMLPLFIPDLWSITFCQVFLQSLASHCISWSQMD